MRPPMAVYVLSLLVSATATGQDQPVHTVEEVVVTGSRTEHAADDAPVTTEVVTRAEIDTSGAENAADLLEKHPGVQVARSFRGAGVRLQGLDSKHVLILVDGERVTGRVDGVIDLRRFPVEDIARVEIVKGPSSALYGSEAMGGVINIITRRARDPIEAEAHARYGTSNALDLSARVGLNTKFWNSRFSAGWHRVDAFDLSPGEPGTSGSSSSELNIANRTEYKLDPQTSIIGRGSYLVRDMAGVDANPAGGIFDRINRTEVMSSSLGTHLDLTGSAKLKILGLHSLSRDQFVYDQLGSDALDQYQETKEQLSQLTIQYDRPVLNHHMVTVGTEGLYQRLESQRLTHGRGDRYRGAIFAQNEWSILDDPILVAVVGARLDMDSSFGVHPTPKVALRYDPHESLTLRASYGLGFRAPVFKELLLLFQNPSAGYIVEGNPNLKPEVSRSLNLGAEYHPAKQWSLSANLFRNDLDDLIVTESIDGGAPGAPVRHIYSNVESAHTQGLELTSQVAMATGIVIKVGYALTETQDETRKRTLEGRALHRGTLTLRYHNKTLGLDGTVRSSIVGARPFYEDNDADGIDETIQADPYATVDLRLAKSLAGRITLFLGVANLLDSGDAAYLPIQPRFFYAGLTGRL